MASRACVRHVTNVNVDVRCERVRMPYKTAITFHLLELGSKRPGDPFLGTHHQSLEELKGSALHHFLKGRGKSQCDSKCSSATFIALRG